MSIRPVDMQLMVQKSPEVNKLNQNELQRPELVQQQFADKLHKQVELDDQQVIQSSKTEKREVDKDGRGNTGGGASSSRKRKEKKEDDSQKKSSVSMFDVSI